MKRIVIVMMAIGMAFLFSSCGAKKETFCTEDTPWNHGSFAIMETDDGYYYNQGKGGVIHGKMQYVLQCLSYVDKETGMQIYLCDKPECTHDGENDCESTYKNLRADNSVLYGGSIYVLGTVTEGKTVSIDLYKASLDGSTMDKVGNVIQAENTKDQSIYCSKSSTFFPFDHAEDSCFIIHDGYAYITYYLQLGDVSSGLKGAGVCRMNLENGETEEIYKSPYVSSSFPIRLTAVGDYVYFNLGETGTVQKSRRWVISAKELQKVNKGFIGTEEEEKKSGKDCPGFVSVFYSADRVYGFDNDAPEGEVWFTALDAETGEVLEEEEIKIRLNEDGVSYGGIKTAFLYDGKLFLGFENVACFYDLEGTLLARVKAPLDSLDKTTEYGEKILGGTGTMTAATLYRDYKINNGKLYFLFSSQAEEMGSYAMYEAGVEGHFCFQKVHVFSCSLEHALQGKEEWKEAYVTEQGR